MCVSKFLHWQCESGATRLFLKTPGCGPTYPPIPSAVAWGGSVPFPGRLRRLKELNDVAGRVYAENLFASRPLHNVVLESYIIVLEP